MGKASPYQAGHARWGLSPRSFRTEPGPSQRGLHAARNVQQPGSWDWPTLPPSRLACLWVALWKESALAPSRAQPEPGTRGRVGGKSAEGYTPAKVDVQGCTVARGLTRIHVRKRIAHSSEPSQFADQKTLGNSSFRGFSLFGSANQLIQIKAQETLSASRKASPGRNTRQVEEMPPPDRQGKHMEAMKRDSPLRPLERLRKLT